MDEIVKKIKKYEIKMFFKHWLIGSIVSFLMYGILSAAVGDLTKMGPILFIVFDLIILVGIGLLLWGSRKPTAPDMLVGKESKFLESPAKIDGLDRFYGDRIIAHDPLYAKKITRFHVILLILGIIGFIAMVYLTVILKIEREKVLEISKDMWAPGGDRSRESEVEAYIYHIMLFSELPTACMTMLFISIDRLREYKAKKCSKCGALGSLQKVETVYSDSWESSKTRTETDNYKVGKITTKNSHGWITDEQDVYAEVKRQYTDHYQNYAFRYRCRCAFCRNEQEVAETHSYKK